MKGIMMAAAVLLMMAGAFAVSVEMPQSITVGGETVSFYVMFGNSSASDVSYKAEYYAPFGFSVANAKGTIKAGSSQAMKIIIASQPELAGQSYFTTLQVTAGNEILTKKQTVRFEAAPQASAGAAQQITGLFAAAYGAVLGNSLDIVLAFVAAILMIAFIARFVKRLEAMRE